jgi:hypothetical protein
MSAVVTKRLTFLSGLDTNKGKTMKTTQELDVELALLKIDIEEKRQYEVLSNLKQRKSFLLTRIANATVRERREAERRARNAVSAARRKAQRLAKKYDIEWDDDSYREFGVYNHFHYFPQPVWLNDDPLKDGHYANNWDETLWLVEFYAKHHPEHPDHENREYLEIAPHC